MWSSRHPSLTLICTTSQSVLVRFLCSKTRQSPTESRSDSSGVWLQPAPPSIILQDCAAPGISSLTSQADLTFPLVLSHVLFALPPALLPTPPPHCIPPGCASLEKVVFPSCSRTRLSLGRGSETVPAVGGGSCGPAAGFGLVEGLSHPFFFLYSGRFGDGHVCYSQV